MRARRAIDSGVAICRGNWALFSEGQRYRYTRYTGGRVVVEGATGERQAMSRGCFASKFAGR